VFDFLNFCGYKFVYCIIIIIIVMPTNSLTLYISGRSLEGMNQEANNVTST